MWEAKQITRCELIYRHAAWLLWIGDWFRQTAFLKTHNVENIQVTNTPASEQARFRAVDVTRDTETKAVLRVGCPGPSVWCWSRKRFNQTGSNARRKGERHNLAMLTVNTQVTSPSLTTSCLAPAGLPTVGDRKWPCFLLRRTWFFQSRRAAKTATGDVEPKAGTGVEAQSFYFYSSPSNWTSH